MRKIEFVYPKTLAVNMGSRACELNCKHCGGHYLKAMTPAFLLQKEKLEGYKSVLLSGGCDIEGEMFLDGCVWERIKEERVNLHIGHYNMDKFLERMSTIDYISMDFTLDSEIIQDIYHLKQTDEDFIRRFEMLHSRFLNKVVPHICIGLNYGRVKEEYKAIEYFSRFNIEKIVFIVFIPTPGTEMAQCEKPEIDDVINLFHYARERLASTKIQLGCMRPTGRYRQVLEERLISQNLVDTIVMPCRSSVELAHVMGYECIKKEACCVFE